MGAEMVGFGGMDEVRFRGTVVPGDRLVIAAQKLQLRLGAMIRCRFQCSCASRSSAKARSAAFRSPWICSAGGSKPTRSRGPEGLTCSFHSTT